MESSNCPQCKKKIVSDLTSPDLVASGLVNDIEVLCNNTGCEWKGKLESFSEHPCNFNISNT
jgi:hypothetical protein